MSDEETTSQLGVVWTAAFVGVFAIFSIVVVTGITDEITKVAMTGFIFLYVYLFLLTIAVAKN